MEIQVHNTKFKPKVISLSSNHELISAISNDIDYSKIFSYQLETLATKGDLLILISSSGNSKNIVIEAYSQLVHAKRMDEPRLVSISEELGKTPAQVLIRWAMQRGMVVLPKSVNESRIIENFAVFDFEISDSLMKRLDDLDETFVTCWDPHNPPSYAPV